MVSLGYTQIDEQDFAVAIVRDMTSVEKTSQKLRSLTAELSEQLAVATAASDAKSKFLANMSHELRTPLNAVIGFSEALHMDVMKLGIVEKYREYAHQIHQSGLHLLFIIGDILDFARIESGEHQICMETVSAAALWELPVSNQSIVALNNQIDLVFDPPPQDVIVRADIRGFQQCLLNVIGNAIKFSPPGSTVTCETHVHDERVVFRISDNGRGIAEEDLSRVCKPFEQVGNTFKAETQGSGLGLAITQELMGLMNGQISIESKFGAGTTVALSLERVITHEWSDDD